MESGTVVDAVRSEPAAERKGRSHGLGGLHGFGGAGGLPLSADIVTSAHERAHPASVQ